MMRGKLTSLGIGIGALVLGCAPAALWAGGPHAQTKAHVITRDGPSRAQTVERVHLDERDKVHVVYHPVVAMAATVSRALHEQPVAPHLVHLVVVNTPITIDPYARLSRETGGIDEDHYLHEAQRAYFNRHARSAYVIHGPSKSTQRDQPAQQMDMTPRAIIGVPQHIRDRPRDPRGPRPIPQVPAPPKEDNAPTMARSD